MDRKLVGAMVLLLFASTGCRMCSSCCDDLPPVLDGPYSNTGGRAGSAFDGVADAVPLIQAEPITPTSEEPTTPTSEEPFTPTSEEKAPEEALEKQVLFAQPVVQLADTDD